MRTFYDCKTEAEKQDLRDEMLIEIYYQMAVTRREVSDIKKTVEHMEQKLVYVGVTPEERKYLNIDGTLNLGAINDMCDNILQVANVIDETEMEDIADGKGV